MAPTIQGNESMSNATERANARALPETTNRRAVLGAIIAGGAVAAMALPAAIATPAALPPADAAEGELVTLEQMAAMNFEPWVHRDDEWMPPSNEEWVADAHDRLPLVRFAWLLMYKTKDELEASVVRIDETDGEMFETMISDLVNLRKRFQRLADVVNAAECRIMCAASAVEFRENGPDEEEA
jgi:hypothetical protein